LAATRAASSSPAASAVERPSGHGRPRGEVGGVDGGSAGGSGRHQIAPVERAGAIQQVADGSRQLKQLLEAQLVDGPARVAFHAQLDEGVVRNARGPCSREVIDQRELDLGRPGRAAGGCHGHGVERRQAQRVEAVLDVNCAVRPGVARADAHASRRAQHAGRPGLKGRLDRGADLRVVGGPARVLRVRVDEDEQAVRDASPGAGCAHDVNVSGRGGAARECVHGGTGAQRVAL
jgi:hypothetical protein